MDFRKRGIRHRIITEITSENLSYCKNLMEFVDELRHLDQIKGNFSVSERNYQATAVIQEAQPITHSMYTTVRSFIEQQQYVFDTLWHKALIHFIKRTAKKTGATSREWEGRQQQEQSVSVAW